MHLKHAAWLGGLGLAVLASAGVAADAPSSAAPVQHRDGRVHNNRLDFEPKGLGELLQWKLQAALLGRPPAPQQPTPQVPADVASNWVNARAVQRGNPPSPGSATPLRGCRWAG